MINKLFKELYIILLPA